MVNGGRVVAISSSTEKGVPKSNLPEARLEINWGIVGDAHAGKWHRQISLLALESIDKIRALGLSEVQPGDFAENITTAGFDLMRLRIGDRLQIGECELEITQIGKECHSRCSIYAQVGDCVMPREGIFARVLKSGMIRISDSITKLDSKSSSAD
jgi:MOSC domain-containing protein YiiM